jgi:hypothetical protein
MMKRVVGVWLLCFVFTGIACAAEKDKIQLGFFAADTEQDYIQARDYAIKKDSKKVKELYDGKAFCER